MTPITQDNGIVILDTENKTYYCGLNTWDKQLRKAKIYHQERYANDLINDYVVKGKTNLVKMHVMLQIIT